MPNPFQAAGADKVKATRYAPIWTNRFHTGLWTQRSPLRDAASQYLTERFYGGRYESLIDGQNVELTTRLTLARRPGVSAYNSSFLFPRVNRFYGLHLFDTTSEIIKVMADTSGVVYDITAPSLHTAVFTKSAGAGSTYFQSVGNTLYMGNGVDQKQWIQSARSWSAATLFNSGDYLVDSNNNLQVALGARSANISATACASNVITMTFTGKIALLFFVGMRVTFAGLTNSAGLNGVTATITSVNYNQITFAFVAGSFSTVSDTGTASCAGGNTGGSAPAWGNTTGAITADGNQQWLCKGSSVQNWGIVAPISAPTAVNSTRPAPYPNWAANTVYSPSLSIIGVSGGTSYIQTLTTGGTTGGAEPVWNATPGLTTNDGSAQWTNSGLAAWAGNTAYALNRIIAVTWTYYVTIVTENDADVPVHGRTTTTQTVAVTTSAFFQATKAGTTAAFQPDWTDGVGSTVTDNTVTWTNIGAQATWTSTVGATTLVSTAQTVIDTNGNKETISTPGKSSGAAPTWATVSGKSTIDNTAVWINAGSYSGANTGAWLYAYAFKNSVTNMVSTASTESLSITQAANKMVTVQGQGSSDTQVDTIQIYRTLQGGSTLFLLDEIPAPGGTATWTYNDTSVDAVINEFVSAPIASSNNPPPTGLIALTYHLGKIWGAVGNTVYYSGGSTTVTGNGNEAFPPLNSFVFPSKVTRMMPNTLGLLIFTVSDIYLISGLATSNSPLYSVPFITGIGLKSYDAFDVNGSIIYMMSTDGQVLSLDPSSGISEVGFPIGDKLAAFDPATSYLTWHVDGSSDKGLYVSDGLTGWYRMSPTSAPETGLNWSPFAKLGNISTLLGVTTAVGIGGCSAVQSIEVNPGEHKLLIGPANLSTLSAPPSTTTIYQRDLTASTDGGNPFAAFATFGSIVLAQPGQMAEMAFITTDSIAIGTRPGVNVLLDEIAANSTVGFTTLATYVNDPPLLAASSTLYANRYYFNQTQQPAWCRHLQIKFTWAAEAFANELLSFTIYGSVYQEK